MTFQIIFTKIINNINFKIALEKGLKSNY